MTNVYELVIISGNKTTGWKREINAVDQNTLNVIRELIFQLKNGKLIDTDALQEFLPKGTLIKEICSVKAILKPCWEFLI